MLLVHTCSKKAYVEAFAPAPTGLSINKLLKIHREKAVSIPTHYVHLSLTRTLTTSHCGVVVPACFTNYCYQQTLQFSAYLAFRLAILVHSFSSCCFTLGSPSLYLYALATLNRTVLTLSYCTKHQTNLLC